MPRNKAAKKVAKKGSKKKFVCVLAPTGKQKRAAKKAGKPIKSIKRATRKVSAKKRPKRVKGRKAVCRLA